MIDLYYWMTPNGHKITIFLEEAGLKYEIHPINIGNGDQFAPEFLKIAPNNRIPAIVDHAPNKGKQPISVFESGAILLYLAEKTGKFLAQDLAHRTKTLEWLMWQMGGLGPMLGQFHHFHNYAPETVPYAKNRYQKEAERLYGVLDNHLKTNEYLAGDYSIADMAAYPWTVPHKNHNINPQEFPHFKRWLEAIYARPAVKAAYQIAEDVKEKTGIDKKGFSDDEKSILFNQGRR